MARKGKIKCSCCGEEKSAARDFYSSSSKLHKSLSTFPMCKNCVEELYDELVYKYAGDKKIAAKRLFVMLDVYYDEDLYNTCINKENKGKSKWLGEYMKTKANARYVSKSSLDNINSKNLVENDIDSDFKLNETKINNDMVERWGAGLRKEDYMFLENKFNEFSIAYQCKRPAEKMLLEQISKCLLKSDEALRNGDATGFEKMNTLISKLMNDANIKPIQEASLAENETITWGTWIDKIENYRPIGEPSEQFKDVDKIKTYINKWFIGQMRKVFDLASEDNPNDDQD
ncbi:hypothetical protein C4071_00380 [Clostridioides difficile]|uniref:hypothetical protein n=1 Tax=Clostridioides difficile TaxID=1496 RepID=UPI000E155BD8|nr:hypothetical protein [Clostridioides difficile]EGT4117279.1 hypothetical protein [Clostridioides difficile]MCJ0133609.1 hypothetical protein [Clostridioides difficile]MCJ0174289.1 hypothetical protein [Clostridioides difficile]MDB0345866.1 hypothetical protein [Clostridioides difficile]MDB0465129.1 hypothetical protein [Clostridioides difficile]